MNRRKALAPGKGLEKSGNMYTQLPTGLEACPGPSHHLIERPTLQTFQLQPQPQNFSVNHSQPSVGPDNAMLGCLSKPTLCVKPQINLPGTFRHQNTPEGGILYLSNLHSHQLSDKVIRFLLIEIGAKIWLSIQCELLVQKKSRARETLEFLLIT